MDVKEFARLGGKARAKKLGKAGLRAHAVKMVAARKARALFNGADTSVDGGHERSTLNNHADVKE